VCGRVGGGGGRGRALRGMWGAPRGGWERAPASLQPSVRWWPSPIDGGENTFTIPAGGDLRWPAARITLRQGVRGPIIFRTPRNVQSPRPPATALSKKLHSLPSSNQADNST